MSSLIQETNPNEIRVLAVRQPWASLIVGGFKTLEIRSMPTNIREKVAIYATNYSYTNKEKDLLFKHFENLLNNGMISDYVHNYAYSSVLSGGERGQIIGTVDIYTVNPMIICDSEHDLNDYKNMHLAPSWLFDYEKQYWFWELENPVKFSEPIPYKPPKGVVVWSKTELPEGYQ